MDQSYRFAGSLSRQELVQLDAYLTGSLLARQNEFLQYHQDALQESWLDSGNVAIRFALGGRWHRNWWVQVGQYIYEPQFVEFVNNLLASPVQIPVFRDLDTYFTSLKLAQADN